MPNAELAAGSLEAAGIEAFLADEWLVGVDWLYSQAVGWVRVRVRESDAQFAQELLGSDLTAQLPESENPPDPCPACGSDFVYVEKGMRIPLLVSFWLIPLSIAFLFTAPLGLWRSRLVCRSCGLKVRLPARIRLRRVLAFGAGAVLLACVNLGLYLFLGWGFVFLYDLTHAVPYAARE